MDEDTCESSCREIRYIYVPGGLINWHGDVVPGDVLGRCQLDVRTMSTLSKMVFGRKSDAFLGSTSIILVLILSEVP